MPGLKPGFGRLASLDEALAILFRLAPDLGSETIALREAPGRVLAGDVVAGVDVPHFDKSAMDGYALRAADTFGSGAGSPATLRCVGSLWPGGTFAGAVGPGECLEIGTGAAMPDGADSVVMVEYTEGTGADEISVFRAVAPGDNVIRAGSDVARGTAVLSAGTVVQPRHVGVLSALGMTEAAVRVRPRVSLFSTGNEILQPGQELQPGKIFDINTWTLRAALEVDGCVVTELGPAPDTRPGLAAAYRTALEDTDLVLLSGGSSLGGGDLVGDVLDEVGRTLVHGVAIKPGKPVVIGSAPDASGAERPVIGLPGYPMSCLSDYYILVQPLLDRALGRRRPRSFVDAVMSRKHPSTVGRYEFLPVLVVDGLAVPLTKGSSAITSLSEATGFVEIAENVEVVEKGEPVRVRLF